MPREKEDFRVNLELLLEHFPNKKILTIREVSEYLGKSPNAVRRRFDYEKGKGITIVSLARQLS